MTIENAIKRMEATKHSGDKFDKWNDGWNAAIDKYAAVLGEEQEMIGGSFQNQLQRLLHQGGETTAVVQELIRRLEWFKPFLEQVDVAEQSLHGASHYDDEHGHYVTESISFAGLPGTKAAWQMLDLGLEKGRGR